MLINHELFLRGVTKRHPPPFVIEPSPRSCLPGWSEAISRWRLVDGRGDVVRRFSKWRYAYSALCGMYARNGLEAPEEVVARRLAKEEQWAMMRAKEARRKLLGKKPS